MISSIFDVASQGYQSGNRVRPRQNHSKLLTRTAKTTRGNSYLIYYYDTRRFFFFFIGIYVHRIHAFGRTTDIMIEPHCKSKPNIDFHASHTCVRKVECTSAVTGVLFCFFFLQKASLRARLTEWILIAASMSDTVASAFTRWSGKNSRSTVLLLLFPLSAQSTHAHSII